MSNNRWRAVLKVSRDSIRRELYTLDCIEFGQSTWVNCPWREDACWKRIEQIVAILKRTVPNRVQIEFENSKKYPEIRQLMESDLWDWDGD
ncbi:hypothetical protein JH67_02945 [Listeria monocytogenes]|nr:hypothetical protein [Listeria monocytogenes]